MSTPRLTEDRSPGLTYGLSWGMAGIIAGLAGLAVSHAVTMVLTLRSTPLVAVAETVVALTPGEVVHWAIEVLGPFDKPVLMLLVILGMLAFFLAAGRMAESAWWKPVLVYLFMGAVGMAAVLTRYDGRAVDALSVAAAVVTWITVLSFLTDPMRQAQHTPPSESGHTRRSVLIRAAIVAASASGAAVVGDVVGRKRRDVEKARRLLRLGLSNPPVPGRVRVGLDDVTPWRTTNDDFYQIHTAFAVPAIEPGEWRLRIHGMVEREVTYTLQDLLDRELTEDWITLNCVSNPVGGDLIGNAWWSGVRVAPLLAEAGVHPDADAVLQTSHDGWNCGTPLAALTDDRNALIAFGMNGEPLPLDHGFPARMIVPGLYGYVSACKWLVDIEVSRFDRIEAFWTENGWSEQGPVKISSRIDVPRSGQEVPAGAYRIGGVAWAQHTGIRAVEYALDGGPWTEATLGGVAGTDVAPNLDTWVQWAATVELAEGDHELLVRAIGRDGEVQTGVERDVLPDGATGWHSVEFSAESA